MNWVKQRSRWYKGYLQTWLVHMRRPVVVHRDLGWRGALGLHLFVLGTPLTALINPLFWALTLVWFAAETRRGRRAVPAAGLLPGVGVCFLLGNAAVVYINVLTIRVINHPGLLVAALLSRSYWVMMSIAAAKAAYSSR